MDAGTLAILIEVVFFGIMIAGALFLLQDDKDTESKRNSER